MRRPVSGSVATAVRVAPGGSRVRQQLFLRRVVHVGLVVRDVESSARRCYEAFGIGPWCFYTFTPDSVENMRVHGERVDHAMRIGSARIGEIEWELIQPLDDNSIYAEHLQQYGEGLHHVLVDAGEYDEARARLSRDFLEVASGEWAGHPYSYFDTRESLGCLVEICREPTRDAVLPPPDGRFP
jgi:glyoxalase/bleomycin resistance protein/dioxygenase superfamily protein